MKRYIFNIMLTLAALVAAEDGILHAQERKTVSIAKIGNVLYCLQSKLADFDYLPPRIATDQYRVRYYYGVQHPWTDENNELHLLVYGEAEKSATLYEIYFENRERKPVVTLGLAGKFIRKNGQLVPSEILFGIGTKERIQKLANIMVKEPALVIPTVYVRPGKAVCDAP